MLLRVLRQPGPLRAALAREIIRRCLYFPTFHRLEMNAVDRAHYGHCIFGTACLANSLKYPRVRVIEFGCGGDNGLVNAEMHIAEVQKLLPVKFELYGFDTGTRLPPLFELRDFPHHFKPIPHEPEQLTATVANGETGPGQREGYVSVVSRRLPSRPDRLRLPRSRPLLFNDRRLYAARSRVNPFHPARLFIPTISSVATTHGFPASLPVNCWQSTSSTTRIRSRRLPSS